MEDIKKEKIPIEKAAVELASLAFVEYSIPTEQSDGCEA